MPVSSRPSCLHTLTPSAARVSRPLALAGLAILTLALSLPAAADWRHEHRSGPYAHHVGSGHHHGHPVHKHHPRNDRGPKHHNGHHAQSYSNHHHKHRHEHQRPMQGFSLTIHGITPLLSGHGRYSDVSFHYHGQQRCYHRH